MGMLLVPSLMMLLTVPVPRPPIREPGISLNFFPEIATWLPSLGVP